MSKRREQIEAQLDQGIPPSEQNLRWLLADHADKEQTITALTDAALDFLHAWIEATGNAQGSRFDDHAGQIIDK